MSSSRRQYPFHLIEPKWQKVWDAQQAFRAFNPGEEIPANHPFAQRHKLSGKVSAAQLPTKFYILDMFPYPSGAGLHVGHPEGYTATDILARYKRAQGFNVLHPMGWDAFGLPAEQYAVKTGQHPRQTTEENIATFKRQIQSLGFSYDWSRELATTDPDYFQWTQWIFLKLYNSWFNPKINRAEPIEKLEFPSEIKTEEQKRIFRDSKRLAFVSEQPVWWCEQLGTVLANEEVVDGKSEVGGFPVVRKPMRQWMLRITAYAEKLLADLDTIDWTDSLKEMQRNWIGRSEGAEVDFQVAGSGEKIRVFTTRPDTLFGATYMVLSPEHKLLKTIIPEDWPAETPYYWRGQLYRDKENSVVVKASSSESAWHGQSAPPTTIPLLTREQTEQKAQELGLEKVSLAHWKPETNLIEAVPYYFARHYRVVPLEITTSVVILATDNPVDLPSFDALGFVLRKEIRVKVTSTEDLEAAHQAYPPRLDGIFTEMHFDSPQASVANYQKFAAGKSDLERTELAKEKSGVFTGAYAINPVNGEKIPIWIADYVLASYGTGAIMAVPAHDIRDFDFAKNFGLNIKPVVGSLSSHTFEFIESRGYVFDEKVTVTANGKDVVLYFNSYQPDVNEGLAVNSSNSEISLNGLPTAEAKKKITDWLESKNLGKKTINYKLRDWLFSRQRYWGEPFPIVWKIGPDGESYHEALPESSLPVLPPTLEDYKPTATGEPPLARAKDWVNLPDGSVRETNTMPQWAGSCWYYLRYLDAKNNSAFVGKDVENYWMKSGGEKPGVDLYVGGTEHAVLHLLYARFWHKVLFDLGHVSTPEPFFKLVNQGMVLGEDNQKMSKSRGNVIPVDVPVAEAGTDSLRLYEMFMGPLEMVKPWNTKGVEGVYRFLGRVWRLFVDEKSETEFEQAETTATESQRHEELLNLIKLNSSIQNVAATPAQLKTLHACIKKVTEDLDGLRFNTAISAMMVFVNDAITWETKPISVLREFLILLQPFAPHIAEELWAKLTTINSQPSPNLAYASWPKFDPTLLVESEIEIAVQVNGKLRDVIKVSVNATPAELEALALANEKAKPYYEGKTIRKIIVVPKKLVNIVAA